MYSHLSLSLPLILLKFFTHKHTSMQRKANSKTCCAGYLCDIDGGLHDKGELLWLYRKKGLLCVTFTVCLLYPMNEAKA